MDIKITDNTKGVKQLSIILSNLIRPAKFRLPLTLQAIILKQVETSAKLQNNKVLDEIECDEKTVEAQCIKDTRELRKFRISSILLKVEDLQRSQVVVLAPYPVADFYSFCG